MQEFIWSEAGWSFVCVVGASIVAVISTVTLFYEILRIVWQALPKLQVAPRKRIIFVILAAFAGHTLNIWLYGALYWALVRLGEIGSLGGAHNHEFLSYVYFSAATYSSLGFGDVVPEGNLRMIAGVEVLNGLVLIGWTVSFTYLAMEKFWDLHEKRNKK